MRTERNKVVANRPAEFLSLTIPALWVGLRGLDWLFWRVRD
jgi:hypothetical protein